MFMDLKMIIMREYVEKLNSKNRNKPQRNNQIEILELKNKRTTERKNSLDWLNIE